MWCTQRKAALYCAFDVLFWYSFHCCCDYYYYYYYYCRERFVTKAWPSRECGKHRPKQAALALELCECECVSLVGWERIQLGSVLYFVVNIPRYIYIFFYFPPVCVRSIFLCSFPFFLICFIKHNVLFERESKRTHMKCCPAQAQWLGRWARDKMR